MILGEKNGVWGFSRGGYWARRDVCKPLQPAALRREKTLAREASTREEIDRGAGQMAARARVR